MLLLSDQLYQRCHHTFRRCREFRTYSQLRAVFVTDKLRAYRLGLRNTEDSVSLIDQCIEFLIEQYLTDGSPVFLHFVAALRDRYDVDDSLYHDLNAIHTEIESIARREVSAPPPSPQLSRRLSELLPSIDFIEQVSLARRVLTTHAVAGLLLHGVPECGQQMLLSKLIHTVPGWQQAQRIRIDLGSNGIGKSLSALWRQLGARLSFEQEIDKEQVLDGICRWLQTQHVVFIFDNVDSMLPKLLPIWIEEFWGALVPRAAKLLKARQLNTRLLMFLVDHSGEVSDGRLPLVTFPNLPEHLVVPIYLPPVQRFTADQLEAWINAIAYEVLPPGITAHDLLKHTNDGLPDLVYGRICRLCNVSYEGEVARWLI